MMLLRKRVLWLSALLVGVVTAACGGTSYQVTTTVVTGEHTRDIWVTAPDDAEPDAWGTWPVVYLMHGLGGSGESLSTMAAEIARHGVVVFAPDYRSTEFAHIEQDAECGYRYAVTVAEDFGGDVSRPPAMVGHSMGASLGLFGSMSEDAYGPEGAYDRCYTGTPRSDVIVAIAGCYYEFEGNTFTFDTSPYTNDDAEIVLVVGSEDNVCEPWQSQDAMDALRADGHEVTLIEIDGGDHANVTFHEIVDGEWLLAPDDPAGNEVVEIIMEAIEGSG